METPFQRIRRKVFAANTLPDDGIVSEFTCLTD
jgi:hypothetical protein